MAQNGWWSKNGTTLISLAAALALVAVVGWLWWPNSHATVEGDANRDQDGWEVRYNATLALARRGSPRTDLDVLDKMLDEALQLRNFQAPAPRGQQPTIDEQGARTTVLKTLDAVVTLHQKQPSMDLARLRGPLEKLAQSDNLTLREKAEHALEQLGMK